MKSMEGGKRCRIAEEQISNSLNLASLPEELLLHIFSYFTSRELISTVCLVSKRWHRLGKSSVAILDYSVEPLLSPRKHVLASFLKFVDQIEVESPRLSTSIPVRILKLQLSRRLEGEITQLMKSLARFNFSELFLHSVSIKTMPSVLNNSNFLSVLHLTDCQFPNRRFSAVPTLFYLQQLLLYDVVIEHSQDFFLNLSQKCPSIVELTLTNCSGCEYIDLPAGQYNKLKKLRLHNSYSKYSLGYGYSELYKLQRVRIAAENLERFYLYYKGKNQIDLDIGQCGQLQFLHLHCEQNFPAGFHTTNICSMFPHLKTLFIYLNRPLNDTLRVVNDQLEILTVWNKNDLFIPVDFVTPNLRTFTYVGGEIITDFAPIDASKIRETRIELSSSKTSNVDWFVQLRSYIKKFSKDTVLCLSIYEMAWFHLHNTDDLGIHLPCPIKKMKLYICQSLPQNQCKSLLDCLLWTFHPEILEFNSNINFELVLRKELDYMVTEQHCCKATLVNRCWRHFLKDFKIVRSNSTNRNEPKYFTILFTW